MRGGGMARPKRMMGGGMAKMAKKKKMMRMGGMAKKKRQCRNLFVQHIFPRSVFVDREDIKKKVNKRDKVKTHWA